ncbi:magnesium transporter NIPA-domain-containing protein [Phakopsora pachyrhizi]|uniref:Magnesium transporter NIPA-domain-containing protein n=1 Tax=Phakopsora pachyrhizi TaxID=170000 RepID=A0AAV0BCF9_PHAPC|nr:magnesium transporter NIPA-domain-containing protein [Phakopsora pachyrhizi]CAH7684863.1 magnesium transporter NIPA-domain-containing protein [Phakopsora pachyrhizi]
MSNTTATTPTTTDTSPSPTSTQDLLSLISASLTALKSQESSLASASASVLGKTPTNSTPNSYKIIGIVLALISGLFIGSSFVFKKKGLLNSQQKSIEKGCAAGEGHEYLKSPMWWSGMILMILGEICNFVAYAFADAILVTPMGALSVVISAILSSIFLKERLSFFGKVGCFLCIVGATIIALNAPEEQAASTIPEFQKLFIAPGFLVFGTIVILTALVLIFYVAPKYGKSNMLVFISICSIIGGLSVVCTQGLGASIITSIKGDSQFKYWFMYFLIGFVICTLVTEINYLNKALELYNTAMVTPTYYVMFTFSTLLTSIILFQGLKAPVLDIVTLVLGFLVICSGITLLQMSKIDPKDLALDEKSSIFLNADKELDNESGLAAEEPGVDGLRGFGGLMGSIHRNSLIARQSNASSLAAMHDRNMTRRRRNGDGASDISRMPSNLGSPIQGLRKHGLWDRPMDAPTHSRCQYK